MLHRLNKCDHFFLISAEKRVRRDAQQTTGQLKRQSGGMKSSTAYNLEDFSSHVFSSFVQHLLTCELDGQLLKTVEDCVAKLRRLEAKGRLWSQNMIMDIQGPFLVLSDIETKVGFWRNNRFCLAIIEGFTVNIWSSKSWENLNKYFFYILLF